MKYCIIAWVFLMSFSSIMAQFDLARIEVVHIPRGDGQDIEFNRVRALFNVPVKLNEDTHLIFGADYSLVDVVFIDGLEIDSRNLRDFQTFEVNLAATKKLKNNWRLIATAKPGVTTNAVKNTSFLSELRLSGGMLFYKNEKETKRYDLLVGVYFNAFNGFNFPLPIIKYHKILTDHWSYDLGFPKINLEYTFNERHALKSYMAIDGFNSNLVETVLLSNGTVERFNATVLVTGLKYDFTIKKHLELYLASGYILNTTLNLRDNARNDLFEVNGSNNIYLRTGIKLKI